MITASAETPTFVYKIRYPGDEAEARRHPELVSAFAWTVESVARCIVIGARTLPDVYLILDCYAQATRPRSIFGWLERRRRQQHDRATGHAKRLIASLWCQFAAQDDSLVDLHEHQRCQPTPWSATTYQEG